MSILNDSRRVSDDLFEFNEWLNEVKWEHRKEQWEQEHLDEVYADKDDSESEESEDEFYD